MVAAVPEKLIQQSDPQKIKFRDVFLRRRHEVGIEIDVDVFSMLEVEDIHELDVLEVGIDGHVEIIEIACLHCNQFLIKLRVFLALFDDVCLAVSLVLHHLLRKIHRFDCFDLLYNTIFKMQIKLPNVFRNTLFQLQKECFQNQLRFLTFYSSILSNDFMIFFLLNYDINLNWIGMFGVGAQNGGMTFGSYWQQLSIGFKSLMVITLALGILGIFSSFFELTLANILYYTINRIQLWRLFTSFFVDSSIINVVFNLYLLNTLLPQLEKKYSTSYLIVQVISQTLYCNLIFIIYGQVLVLTGLTNSKAVFTFGLTNLMFIFLWQKVSMNPEQLTRFCCFPCLLPLKYLPWCFLALLLLMGGGSNGFIGCLLGHFQYIFRKKPLFNIPEGVYIKIESWFPHFIRRNAGFVSISSVKANFQQICPHSARSQRVASSEDNEEMSDRVDVGRGVVIGRGQSQQASDFRRHWMYQDQISNIHPSESEQSSQRDAFTSKNGVKDELSQQKLHPNMAGKETSSELI